MYTLEQTKGGQWLIRNADGDVVFLLQPEDESHARAILANLNA